MYITHLNTHRIIFLKHYLFKGTKEMIRVSSGRRGRHQFISGVQFFFLNKYVHLFRCLKTGVPLDIHNVSSNLKPHLESFDLSTLLKILISAFPN